MTIHGTIEFRLGRNMIQDSESDCILWSGNADKDGYGKIYWNKRHRRTHQVVWELSREKKIPKGNIIQHECDNPSCVNPEHLKLGTWLSNMQDKVIKGRLRHQHMGKTHCKNGHKYVAGSFYVYQYKDDAGPKRVCKKCHSKKQKIYREQKNGGTTR